LSPLGIQLKKEQINKDTLAQNITFVYAKEDRGKQSRMHGLARLRLDDLLGSLSFDDQQSDSVVRRITFQAHLLHSHFVTGGYWVTAMGRIKCN
jgi:hypothetical protein